MRQPNRILAIKKRKIWYAAVTDGVIHGGGSGDTYEKAIGEALANFNYVLEGVNINVKAEVAKIFRLPSSVAGQSISTR
jgi:hypothetical protein